METMIRLLQKICNQFSKEKRAYYKMQRKHRKELIKLAKEDRDWDWEYLHVLVITKIRHMYEYQSAGNCVMESEDTPNIIAELKHVLDLQNEIDTQKPHFCINDFEIEKYREIYEYIGSNILGWWD